MQILKYILSKKLICSIAVLHLFLEILKKNPVKEFNDRIKSSRVGPATILKIKLFHSLFLKVFDHDYRKTFRGLFSERFLPEKVLVLKVR